MIFKLGWRDFTRNLLMNFLIIILMVVVFLTGISIVSAIQVKYEKYKILEPYLSQNGKFIRSSVLQCEGCLLRDEAELREKLPNIKDVLAVEDVWEPFVIQRDKNVNAWCYSEAVINMLSPSMLHEKLDKAYRAMLSVLILEPEHTREEIFVRLHLKDEKDAESFYGEIR